MWVKYIFQMTYHSEKICVVIPYIYPIGHVIYKLLSFPDALKLH